MNIQNQHLRRRTVQTAKGKVTTGKFAIINVYCKYVKTYRVQMTGRWNETDVVGNLVVGSHPRSIGNEYKWAGLNIGRVLQHVQQSHPMVLTCFVRNKLQSNSHPFREFVHCYGLNSSCLSATKKVYIVRSPSRQKRCNGISERLGVDLSLGLVLLPSLSSFTGFEEVPLDDSLKDHLLVVSIISGQLLIVVNIFWFALLQLQLFQISLYSKLKHFDSMEEKSHCTAKSL